MKKLIALLMSASLCAPMTVVAANPFAAFDDSPQYMIYMKVPLGSRKNQIHFAGPRFGLSLNREFAWQSDVWMRDNSVLWTSRSLPILDLELGTTKDSFTMNGLNMASSDGKSVWSSPWIYVGIVAGALLVSCVTDNFPCDDDDGMGGSGGGGGY